MDITGLRIAIVGGGYAGAATAKALIHAGATVDLYEQAESSGEVGAGIGLRPSSLAQFRRWGSLPAIEAVTSPSDYFEILTADAHRIALEEWPEKAEYGLTTRFVHRRDFIDALISVLPPESVHFGHRMTTIEDAGATATVTFENGRRIEADLVIGADGIRSQVRYQLFSRQQPVFAGEHAYRAVIGEGAMHGLPLDSNLRMYLGHGTKVYVLPLPHRRQVSFDITALDPDPTPSPAFDMTKMLKTVEGFDERLVQTTAAIDPAVVNLKAVYDIDPVDVWHSDSVVLVGDAAHAMCHHQGQGANSAILDAGAIADHLVAASSVAEGLAAYQAARKPITDELQRLSRQGWSDDEVQSVFPGQKPGEIASTITERR